MPSSSASTGISIFMDSRITSVSPSSTSWPSWHSIFQTVPVMWASTSGNVDPPGRLRAVAARYGHRGPPRDPRDRPGHDRHHLHRLRRGRARSPGAPTASSGSTSRGPAGSSTTRTRSGRSRARSRARRIEARRRVRRSRASASRTSARRWWPGTAAPASRSTARSSGRTGAPRRAATSSAPPGTSSWCASAPGSCSTRTSPARRSSGCAREGGVRRRTPPSGRSTPGSSSSSRAAHVTDYSNASRTLLFDIHALELGRGAVRAARRGPGARCPSRCRARGCSARPASSAARCRWPAWPATSRPRSTARRATSRGSARTPTAPAASCS